MIRTAFQNLYRYRNYGRLLESNLDKNAYELAGSKSYALIQYYRKNGHTAGSLDPLQLIKDKAEIPELLDFGLKFDDIIDVGARNTLHKKDLQSLEDVENYLKKNYCDKVGVEFEHVENPEERQWLYESYERYMCQELSAAERTNIHHFLIQGEAVDHYMHKKFSTYKRYSGEGGEAAIIILRTLYAKASELGVTDVVQSMAHRGRLIQMAVLMDYPPSHIFRKIQGHADIPKEYTTGTCDIAQHLAFSNKKRFHGTGCKEKEIQISVIHNPSHLEAANPVSQGKTKAKQDDYDSVDRVMNVQLHGDAAYAGQGIVYESQQLNAVPNYHVGGTVHIILNNQIGYTTDISDSRGTRYCTALMKAFSVPIIHVNSEDIESVHKISKFLAEYRQKFKKDIMLDLITYRRYGHNEVDEPEFTQPLMYKSIRLVEKGLPTKYHDILTEQGLVKDHDYQKIRDKVFAHLENEFKKSQTEVATLETIQDEHSKGSKAFTHKWKGMKFSEFAQDEHYLQNTGKNKDQLKSMIQQMYLQIHSLRPGFHVHPRIQKHFIDDRLTQVENNEFDWATAETMAVTSLLEEGYNVRMSGEDVERGTFSQRHWVMVDQHNELKWNPIQEYLQKKNSGRFQVSNSPLSEASVIGFDFGYSMENPRNLVIWEAQFGDFYNTAQFMVDTFVTNSEEKWMRQSGLVMLLPHGFDGAGPEHSSSRMERWLQMGVQLPVNFQFVNPSTPANLFHMYRRQMLRSYRKPLIVASAKILLKHKKARSKFEDIDQGTQFQPILIKKISKTSSATFLCSGKIAYDLEAFFAEKGITDYTLITLEELLPFPTQRLTEVLKQVKKSAITYWVQEEPENAGAYRYIDKYTKKLIKDLKYIGRPACPAVAVGYSKLHTLETQQLFNQVLEAVKQQQQ